MSTITTTDGTPIYYKDWGTGQPVVFSHGWPLTSDAWDSQMEFFASRGFRCIAHDRRGHGRSGQTVPIGPSALISSTLVKGATLKVYPGFDHGMCTTHKDVVNADLLAFFQA